MLFQNLVEEMAEATRQEAERSRAESTAQSFTPQMFSNLERNYQTNPSLPPDAQLAVALDPAGQSLFENLSLAYASTPRDPAIGQYMTPTQRRYMEMSPDEQMALEQQVGSAWARVRAPRSRLGQLTSAVGGALDGPAGLVQSGLGAIPGSGAAYTGLKGLSRAAMPVLDVGQQMAQGRGRYQAQGWMDVLDGQFLQGAGNLARSVSPVPLPGDMEQTDLGQLTADVGDGLGQLVTGQDVTTFDDHGSGFFISQDAQATQRRVQAERSMGVLPNGQTYTIGRSLATVAQLDPDSTSYNVLSGLADAAVALSAPGPEAAGASALRTIRRPGARLLGGVSEMEYLSNFGAYRGTARTAVDLTRAEDFIRGDAGTRLVDFLTENPSFARIDEATNASLRPETVRALADATNPDEVRELLVQAVHHGERPTLRTAGQRARDRVGRALETGANSGWSPTWANVRRLGGNVPSGQIDLRDGRAAVDTIRDYAGNVGVRTEVADGWVEAMGRASNHVERFDIYTRVMTETANELVQGGLDTVRARELTRFMRNEIDTIRASIDDMMELDPTGWARGQAGVDDRLLGASILSEMAESLPLPDAREIRRANGWLAPIWEAGLGPDAKTIERVLGATWRTTSMSLTGGFGRLFKDTRLMRLGYPLRVIPEEQLRRVADGTSTLLSHPFGVFGRLLDTRVDDVRPIRGALNPPAPVADDLIEAVDLAKVTPPDPDEVVSGWRRLMGDGYAEASDNAPSGQGLRDLRGEPLSDSDYFDAAMSDSRLGGMRENGSQNVARGRLERFVLRDRDGVLNEGSLVVWRDNLTTLAADPVISRISRNGVDNTLAELRETAVGLSIRERLVSFEPRMADDVFLREYLESMAARIEGLTGGNDELLRLIQQGRKPDLALLREVGGEFGPQAVVGRGVVASTALESGYTRMTNTMFEYLATRPTNRLSRSPVFLERYEQNLVELAPLAANPQELIAGARKANVRQSTLDLITDLAQGQGRLQLTHIDEMAKRGALDHVQELLYDVGQTSQFFDQYRLLFPFGEAWKEVITTWGKLVSEDPFTVARRAGQAAETLQSNDFGQTYFDMAGLDREADTGFFYENDFGDQVFYYPYSEQLTGALTGMPWRMEASARSLNIAGEILPGLGPVGQLGVDRLLPNNTDYDIIRSRLFPYGPPNDIRDVGAWALPNWLNTALNRSTGFTQEQERLFGNTQWRVANHLYSQNPERYQGPNGAQLLEDDARPITRDLFFVRSMVQATAPAAPMLTANIVGANGELVDQSVVADAYRQFQEEDYTTALERLITLYGEGSVLMTQGNTASTVWGGTPFDGAGYDWVRDNPEVADNHPELFGFFAPPGDGSDFSSEAYRRSLDEGERVQLTLQQKFKLAQHRHASSIYAQYRGQVEGTPTTEQQAILNAVREELRLRFPGYQRVNTIVKRDEIWLVIEQEDVDRALADPLLAETPTGRALQAYWDVRAQVVAAAEAEGLGTISNGGWRSADAGKPYRDVLRAAGEQFMAQEPEFGRMWDVFLSNEFDNDIED